MMKWLPVVALILASSPSFAAAEKCLGKAASVEKQLMAAVEHDSKMFEMTIYTGDRAKQLIKAINNQEPKTKFGGDRVLTMTKAGDTPAVMVFIVTKDCVTQAFPPIQAESWNQFLRKTFGDDS